MTHQINNEADIDLQGEALVDRFGDVRLPYDIAHTQAGADGWTKLSSCRDVRHAGRLKFELNPRVDDSLHIINGMGVALGDSIVGITALALLKARHPTLRISLYRTRHAPAHVERLYQLAGSLFEAVIYLPLPVASLPPDVVDLSDFFFWPEFATKSMLDFFMQSLGVFSCEIPEPDKANRWMSQLMLPPVSAAWAGRDYVLFCDRASTSLRSVPDEYAAPMVERIWRHYGLPILGFHAIPHDHYHDISSHSPDLDHFIAWVKGANIIIGIDSSALHIAAAFDVPTMSIFVSIDPALRVHHYPHCRVIDARTALTDGLHHSDDREVLREIRRIWESIVQNTDLPWPSARQP